MRQVCIYPEAHQLDPDGLFTVLFPSRSSQLQHHLLCTEWERTVHFEMEKHLVL